MLEFNFKTDSSSKEYCEEIILEMTSLFGITEVEAYTRINELWSGVEIVGEDDLIYHEDPDYWAKDICYGHDSEWWLDEANAKLKPLKK